MPLDLKLPKVSGLEVLASIRASDTLHLLPVVMLTSSKQESDRFKSYALRVNAYVVKPMEFEKLVRAVADLGAFWALLNAPPPGAH